MSRTISPPQRNSSHAAARQSLRITITTSQQVREHLETLVASGLYGSTVSEAVERLLCESLRLTLKRQVTAALEGRV